MMNKGLLFALFVLFLLLLSGCSKDIETGAGDKDDKFKQENKYLDDGSKVWKESPTEMTINIPKDKNKYKAEKEAKEKDLVITSASQDDDDSVFLIESSTPIIEIPLFEESREWAYNGSGWHNETLTNEHGLIVKGDYVCDLLSVRTEGSGLGKKTFYDDCIYYPPQYEIQEINLVNGSLENVSVNTRQFEIISSTSVLIKFKDYYDPIISEYQENIVSCYSFDEDYTDTKNANNFIPTGTIISATHKVGNGSSFYDGINDYATLAAGGTIQDVNSHTVCGWIYTSDGSNEITPFDMRTNFDGSNGMQMRLQSGVVKWVGNTDCGEIQKTHGTGYPTNQWFFACVGYQDNAGDNTYLTYLNGTYTTYDDSCEYDNPATRVVRFGDIGERNNAQVPSTFNFPGYLDEWVFFDRLLNESEIDELYNSDSGQTCEDVVGLPTSPNNLTVDGSDDFNGNFSGTVDLNCSGSTDINNDTITYSIEKGDNITITTYQATSNYVTQDSDTGNDTIIVSGENCGGECGVDAFDRNTGTKWLILSANTAWVNIELGDGSKRSLSYDITSANDADQRDPDDWTIEGSNDNSTWFVLDNKTGQASIFTSRTTTYEFTMSQPTNDTYLYYKWNVTAIRNPSHNIFQVAELWLIESEPVNETEINYTYIGNHTEDSTYSWDLSSETVGTIYEKFRCRAIDLNGSNTYSSYYTINSIFEISAGAETSCDAFCISAYTVQCSDNCVFTDSRDCDGENIHAVGSTGSVTFDNVDFYNYDSFGRECDVAWP